MDDGKEGFRTPRVEACEIGKFLGANVFLNLIAQRIKENLGSIVHECPYEGVRRSLKKINDSRVKILF
jgi:hypothetical protein